MTTLLNTKPDDQPGDNPQVPEKFRDPETNEVRVDQLLKSYLELEKKYNSAPSSQVPEGPDKYEIKLAGDTLTIDPQLNAKLHAGGFSQEQAQLVYQLAEENLQPLVMEMAAHMQSHQHIESLAQEFGGEEKWRDISRQLSAWGQKNLADDVFEALASSPEGIRTLYKMMNRDEPDLLDGGASASDGPLTEERLKAVMRDPRYWRDRNPEIVARVQKGFERLYPPQ